jgi:hypothetical protein
MSWLAVLVHREQFKIPDTKGPITLQGVSALTSVIKYGDYAEEADNSTSKSATVSVLSDLFIAQDITFAVKLQEFGGVELDFPEFTEKTFLENLSPNK